MDPLDPTPHRVSPPPAAPAAPAGVPGAAPAPAFAADRWTARPTPAGGSRPPTPWARLSGAIVGFVRDLVAPMWCTAAFAPADPPPDKGGLRVVSYNVLLGGQRLGQAREALRRLDADVVCLQETSREATEAIARDLGLHVAFYAGRGPIKGSLKAVLSRYPIAEATDVAFDVPWLPRLARVGAALRAGRWNLAAEPLEGRSMLRATLRVGDRLVDVVDTHLSLGDPGANAAQLDQLARYVAARRAQGRPVIVAGDFNTNLALAAAPGRPPAVADAPGRLDTATDTVAEFRDRHGAGVGNIGDPAVAAAASRLLAGMTSFWEAPARTAIVAGAPITPEQARAELASGRVDRASEHGRRLMAAADGLTHLGARKRFDQVLASPGLRIEAATLDLTAAGSDHQPIMAEVRWQ